MRPKGLLKVIPAKAGIQRVLEVCLEIRSGSPIKLGMTVTDRNVYSTKRNTGSPIKDFEDDSEGHSRESGNPGEKIIWIPNQVGDDSCVEVGDDSCVKFEDDKLHGSPINTFGDDSCVEFEDNKRQMRRFFASLRKTKKGREHLSSDEGSQYLNKE